MRIVTALIVTGLLLATGLAEADNDQLIKYYRKKTNLPPSVEMKVTGVKDSPIKGLKEGTLEIGTPPQSQQLPFVMSADGRYAIFAETEDVTVDPAKAVL